MCFTGPDFTSVSGVYTRASANVPHESLSIGRVGFTSRDGHAYTLIAGRAASDVTAATIELGDGSTIDTTIQNGWFVAWWPRAVDINSVRITSQSGTTEQPLNIAAPEMTGGK